jgi:hypothetical protein
MQPGEEPPSLHHHHQTSVPKNAQNQLEMETKNNTIKLVCT